MDTNQNTIDTLLHIKRVNELLLGFVSEMLKRATVHDNSKLEEPEKSIFATVTGRLSTLTYGSDGYKQSLEELKPALEHHYRNNSHHPEHYDNGINGMDLLDVVEMFFDWKAASERHKDGDIYKSIEYNKTRFDINEQLTDIFKNTADNFNF
jgi:hypothetical protein